MFLAEIIKKYNFSKQITNYLNNNLLKLIEIRDLISYEVSERNGNLTLEMHMKNSDFVKNKFIPSIIKEIQWITSEQIETMNMLFSKKNKKIHKQINVNFDEYKKIIRLYFTQNNTINIVGYNIGLDGSIEKYKEYKAINDNLILTMHYKNKKLIKTNETKVTYNYDKSIYIYIRDDGQKYTQYIYIRPSIYK